MDLTGPKWTLQAPNGPYRPQNGPYRPQMDLTGPKWTLQAPNGPYRPQKTQPINGIGKSLPQLAGKNTTYSPCRPESPESMIPRGPATVSHFQVKQPAVCLFFV